MTDISIEQADVAGSIAALWIYPIKSCAGIRVEKAKLLPSGLEWDRSWMIVDRQGVFITQRELPVMALIQPHIDIQAQVMRLSFAHLPVLQVPLALPASAASGHQRAVQVWDSRVQAFDMGDEAAHWLQQVLGRECRLVRFDPQVQRLSSGQWTAGLQAATHFADGYPLLVMSTGSVDALNHRLVAQGSQPVDGLRFRANIVVDGWAEHEEDFMASMLVAAPEPVVIRIGKPCARCPIPNIDPQTGEVSTQVLDTLSQYRQDARLDGAITFGMNAVVEKGAQQMLHVGQQIGGVLSFD